MQEKRCFDPIDIRLLPSDLVVDLDIGSEAVRQNALRGLCAEWATRQPFYIMNNSVPAVVAGRYHDVREILMDRERFTNLPPSQPGYERFDFFNGVTSLSQMDGFEHDRVRSVFNPSFGPGFVKLLDGAIGRIVAVMLDEVEARGRAFDFINDFAGDLVVRILFDGLLGMSELQQQSLIRMNRAFSLIAHLKPGQAPPQEYLDAQADAVATILNLLAERRERPRENDFISNLVKVHDDVGTVSIEEILNNLFGILGAGQGTTAVSATAMLVNLCKHRDQFNAVLADPSLVPQAVEESLRFQGPGYLPFARFALVDMEIGGTQIFRGMPVLASQQAANLDPDVFPEPSRFDIYRKAKNALTFGAGAHLCLGRWLAVRVLQVVLAQICLRFPRLHLQDEKFEPVYEGMLGELRHRNAPMFLH